MTAIQISLQKAALFSPATRLFFAERVPVERNDVILPFFHIALYCGTLNSLKQLSFEDVFDNFKYMVLRFLASLLLLFS